MRIVCPACDATYDVPDALLAAGQRVVRCAKCGHEWMPTANSVAPLPPEEADFAMDAAFEPVPSMRPRSESDETPPAEAETPDRHEPRLKPLRSRPEARTGTSLAADLPPPRGRVAAILAWTLSILVLVAAGTAVVAWRTQVMAAWPPSERVFAALGLT